MISKSFLLPVIFIVVSCVPRYVKYSERHFCISDSGSNMLTMRFSNHQHRDRYWAWIGEDKWTRERIEDEGVLNFEKAKPRAVNRHSHGYFNVSRFKLTIEDTTIIEIDSIETNDDGSKAYVFLKPQRDGITSIYATYDSLNLVFVKKLIADKGKVSVVKME